MVTSSILNSDRPRVSSNQLGEYPFASEAKRMRMLRDMKFGNNHRAPYYGAALHGVMGSFYGGGYSAVALNETIARLRAIKPRSPNHAIKLRNNVEMLRRFIELAPQAEPPTGAHTLVWRNATMELDGVLISVRPEIVTHCPQMGLASFTKFRFSKSGISADAAEIVLQVLLHYAQQPQFDGAGLDLERTVLVDCYARVVIRGHQLARVRQNQLVLALADIRRRWPGVRPAGDVDEASAHR